MSATPLVERRRRRRYTRYIPGALSNPSHCKSNIILQALVSVYKKILEFYQALCEILSSKGTKLIIKMVLESDRLPSIVQGVMNCSNILHNLVQTTTLRILQDIEDRIIHDQGIFLSYG